MEVPAETAQRGAVRAPTPMGPTAGSPTWPVLARIEPHRPPVPVFGACSSMSLRSVFMAWNVALPGRPVSFACVRGRGLARVHDFYLKLANRQLTIAKRYGDASDSNAPLKNVPTRADGRTVVGEGPLARNSFVYFSLAHRVTQTIEAAHPPAHLLLLVAHTGPRTCATTMADAPSPLACW